MSHKPKKPIQLLPSRTGRLPSVAILGRPNVGKSSLFNRLSGRQVAIVEDEPGVTRDRLYADADIYDKPCTLIDMGGFEATPDGDIEEGISRQCKVGLEEADLVLFVVDGRVPPTSGDHDTVELLRRSDTPSILVINKVDGAKWEGEASDAFSLGLDPAVMVSALHGRGVADLLEMMHDRLPEPIPAEEEEDDDGVIRVAIIGRPNAGKSSLINRFLGEDRLLTMDQPGTTRDAVDSYFEKDDKRYILVDTAGLRRKRSVSLKGPEKLATSAAVRALERCDICVLLVDADGGIAEQDAKIVGLATERGRGLVIGFNKWDLMKGDQERSHKIVEQMRDVISFAPWARFVRVSAKSGRGLDKLLVEVNRAHEEFTKRVSTSKVNELFDDIVAHHPPPMRKGRPVKLYFATQASIRPPTFVVQTSYPEALHFSYRRYVENRIRETFGFDSTPVRVIFRKRKRRGDK